MRAWPSQAATRPRQRGGRPLVGRDSSGVCCSSRCRRSKRSGNLVMSGVAADAARQINLIARGHPLALNMATSIVLLDARRTVEEAGRQVIQALSRSYIEAVPDPMTRRALEASSVVRCVTEPLLHASGRTCPHVTRSNGSPYCHSSSLVVTAYSFMMPCGPPLPALSATRDPDAHRNYRRAAWAFLQNRLRLVHGKVEPWRYTADLLFLIQNPLVREAFFPERPTTARHRACHTGRRTGRAADRWCDGRAGTRGAPCLVALSPGRLPHRARSRRQHARILRDDPCVGLA